LDQPLDCLKIAIPSLLYLVQNTLLYVALSNLSAPLFQVTYQSKLLTTAIVSVLMLNRRYSLQQWLCLTLLGVGVAIVVLGESKKDEPSETESVDTETENNTDGNNGMQEQSMSVGLISVTIACVSSALAGVYFEKVLKKTTTAEVGGKPQAPVSLWMRNIQMAFFSVCIALVQYMTSKSSSSDEAEKPFMHGFTGWVYCLVGLQAGGGMLVAAVIKYADNVLKGLATGVSVVVATGCSMALFGTPLTTQFTMGASIILTSVYFFSNEIACLSSSKNNKTSKDGAEMMKPILPR
jgi:UDP-sugar transporter A1/2/3